MKALHTIIIYAEDDEDDRMLMKEAVDEILPDSILITAINGIETLKKLEELSTRQTMPCVIALDGNMPLMTGKETIREIRKNKNWDDIPLCIFSTSAEQWFNDVADIKGVSVYRKPTTLAQYKETIRQMLDHCMT